VEQNYWNHNTAFHRELVARLASTGGRILDVGCGDGLLLQRLASAATEVVGIDSDPSAITRARHRLRGVPNSRLIVGDVLTSGALDTLSFDAITCVATLHHMPLSDALLRFRQLLRPNGTLIVVGLAANTSPLDWMLSGAQLLPLRLISRLRHESDDVGVVTAQPKESLREIRAASRTSLPGAVVRRRFYYRYTLAWRKPAKPGPLKPSDGTEN
jgi:2-polyprenyl-3-methyl-5-hydroxy-6-metoxy-1,4-benzoquinol methylase